MTNHDHIASVTHIYPNEVRETLVDRGMNFLRDHNKLVSTAALGALAIAGIASLKGLEGGSNDPSRFAHDTNVTQVHFDEGANIRYDPLVDSDTPPITTLDKSITIDTPNGAYSQQEFHNGEWIGVDAANIPGFDAKGDKDGIVWVNEQKASETTK